MKPRIRTLSTDLDETQEFSDDRDFTKGMIVYWLSGFFLGAFIATFLIMGVMALID